MLGGCAGKGCARSLETGLPVLSRVLASCGIFLCKTQLRFGLWYLSLNSDTMIGLFLVLFSLDYPETHGLRDDCLLFKL